MTPGVSREIHGTIINSQTTNSVPVGARDMGSPEGLAHSNSYYVPKIMVTNVMSIVPKMSEVCEFSLLRNKVSLAFITEKWLQSSVTVSVIDIPGYSVLRRNHSLIIMLVSVSTSMQ